MKKHDRIATYVETLGLPAGTDLNPCYLGYFHCFNKGEYYEAHDVLEHLWLETTGPDYAYYKGLIQAAGAFVHLRKHYLRPEHPKDGRRLRPACRLFRLAAKNLAPYTPFHRQFHVQGFIDLCSQFAERIQKDDYMVNPWRPQQLPLLKLEPHHRKDFSGNVACFLL